MILVNFYKNTYTFARRVTRVSQSRVAAIKVCASKMQVPVVYVSGNHPTRSFDLTSNFENIKRRWNERRRRYRWKRFLEHDQRHRWRRRRDGRWLWRSPPTWTALPSSASLVANAIPVGYGESIRWSANIPSLPTPRLATKWRRSSTPRISEPRPATRAGTSGSVSDPTRHLSSTANFVEHLASARRQTIRIRNSLT